MKSKGCASWGLTVFLTVAALMVFYDAIFRRGVMLSLLNELHLVLRPILFGMAMAYLLAPLVNVFDRFLRFLTKSRVNRVRIGSVLLVWALVLLAIYLLFSILIPQLYQSALTLSNNAQTYYNTAYGWANRQLTDHPQIAVYMDGAVEKYWGELYAWFTDTVIPKTQETIGAVAGGVLSALTFLKDFLVGMVVSLYLLAKKERFALNSRKLLYSVTSEPMYHLVLRAASRADAIFSGFVRGKLFDSLIIGVLCFLGSLILGLPYAPLVSVFVGVTNVIPFFGPFIGAIPSAFLILLVNPLKCLYFIIFVLVLQQLDGNLIGPKILGNSTELPGFWVVVAILVGGGFFGVLGMFLGVPVFACIYAFARYYCTRRLRDKGVTDDAFFLPADAVATPQPGPKQKSAPQDQK